VLDLLVQTRRNAGAAKRFFKRLLKGLQYAPRVLVTDKLKSYGVAKREILPDVEHRQSRYLNNRAENPHRPTRRRRGKHSASCLLTHSSTAIFVRDVIE
jgi:putative transposase